MIVSMRRSGSRVKFTVAVMHGDNRVLYALERDNGTWKIGRFKGVTMSCELRSAKTLRRFDALCQIVRDAIPRITTAEERESEDFYENFLAASKGRLGQYSWNF